MLRREHAEQDLRTEEYSRGRLCLRRRCLRTSDGVHASKRGPFEPTLGTIERLDFQTRVDGWYLDDVVLTTTEQHRIAHSIKSNAQFSSTSAPSDFVELAWEQWLQIGSTTFDRSADFMGLITAPLPQRAATEGR